MWIVPKAGLQVRNPVTLQLLPEAGYEVQDTDQHWNRCLMFGDVTRGTAPESAPLELEATDAPIPATSGKR